VLSQNFKRIVIISKNNNKAVSQILGIKDKYTAFCIDEAALYVYSKLTQKPEESGNEILKKLAKRK
jgi:alpha-glucuronidase